VTWFTRFGRRGGRPAAATITGIHRKPGAVVPRARMCPEEVFMSSSSQYRSDSYIDYAPGSGWIVFAASMLGIVGVWNSIEGLLGIGKSHVFTSNTTFIFSNLNTWGWILLIVGIVQVLAAFALMQGSQWARWFGIAVAAVNSMVQLAWVPSNPFWGLSMFTVDILIIWALAVYGGRPSAA
jgi:hypothetical protein